MRKASSRITPSFLLRPHHIPHRLTLQAQAVGIVHVALQTPAVYSILIHIECKQMKAQVLVVFDLLDSFRELVRLSCRTSPKE